jgi:hypothetical protein
LAQSIAAYFRIAGRLLALAPATGNTRRSRGIFCRPLFSADRRRYHRIFDFDKILC